MDLVRLASSSATSEPQTVVALRWASPTRLIAVLESAQCTVFDVTARTEVWAGRVADLSGEDLAVCTSALVTAPGRLQGPGGRGAASGRGPGRGTLCACDGLRAWMCKGVL